MTQFGYRIGGLLAGAGSLYLTIYLSWEQIFLVVSLIIFLNDNNYFCNSFKK